VIFVKTAHAFCAARMRLTENALLEFSITSIETFQLKKVKAFVKPANLFALCAFFSQNNRVLFIPNAKQKQKVQTEDIKAYVGLGSNLGDRAGNLLLAVRGLMEASFNVQKLSAIYETEPVEVEGHTPFLNMVAEICVRNVSPSQMLARMLRIEYLLGRREKNEKKPRTVDLDLLLYDDFQCRTAFLDLPHPRLHLRKFVLVPLAELAPHLIHPLLHKSIQEILAETPDVSMVKRWRPNLKLNGE
jgi:2-amino-4-hydroxy-6-hydroxymethyldihydropteridine diphosphokinase